MSSKPNDIEMTTERIDHTAEARKYAEKSLHPSTGSPEVGLVYAQLSNAEATLALVEQQRISNLIALDGSHTEVHSLGRGVAQRALRYNAQTDVDAKFPLWELRPEIAAALGIETGEER